MSPKEKWLLRHSWSSVSEESLISSCAGFFEKLCPYLSYLHNSNLSARLFSGFSNTPPLAVTRVHISMETAHLKTVIVWVKFRPLSISPSSLSYPSFSARFSSHPRLQRFWGRASGSGKSMLVLESALCHSWLLHIYAWKPKKWRRRFLFPLVKS